MSPIRSEASKAALKARLARYPKDWKATVQRIRERADGRCECDPLCANDDHLKQMCQRCHLRYDAPMHAVNARKTRDAKNPTPRML